MGDEELDEMTESMHGAMSLDGDVDKLRTFYDGWAADYDEDVAQDYGMPGMVAATLAETADAAGWTSPRADVAVVDAGCGTGAVGLELAAAGWTDLRGLDLSPEMAAIAESRGVYRSVEGGVDLTAPVRADLDGSADAVTLGGVFTVGHVPPGALAAMATLVRDDGLLVVSTRDAYRQHTAWDEVVAGFVAGGLLEPLVHTADGPYTMDSRGDYWGWRVHR